MLLCLLDTGVVEGEEREGGGERRANWGLWGRKVLLSCGEKGCKGLE